MKKTKRKMLSYMMALVMLFIMVFSTTLISAEFPPPPHLALNLEPSEVEFVPGQEFTVEANLMFLSANAWSAVSFNLQYDPTMVELIPYMICPWGTTRWAVFDSTAPWESVASLSINPIEFGVSGNVRVNLQMHNAAWSSLPVLPTVTFRFRVLDYASGETLIRWMPNSWGAFVTTSPSPWQTESLFFAEPTIETYAHILIPHLGVNLESRVENASPGDEFLVDIELYLLTELSWNIAYLNIFYDRTRLELIPYFSPSLYVGTNPNDPWRIVGGSTNGFLQAYQGYGDVWMATIVLSNIIQNPFTATVTLRFRVRCDATAGDALISWAPAAFGASAWCETLMRYALPTPESFTSVTINI